MAVDGWPKWHKHSNLNFFLLKQAMTTKCRQVKTSVRMSRTKIIQFIRCFMTICADIFLVQCKLIVAAVVVEAGWMCCQSLWSIFGNGYWWKHELSVHRQQLWWTFPPVSIPTTLWRKTCDICGFVPFVKSAHSFCVLRHTWAVFLLSSHCFNQLWGWLDLDLPLSISQSTLCCLFSQIQSFFFSQLICLLLHLCSFNQMFLTFKGSFSFPTSCLFMWIVSDQKHRGVSVLYVVFHKLSWIELCSKWRNVTITDFYMFLWISERNRPREHRKS